MNPAMQTCLNTLRFDHHFFVEKIATLDDDVARKRISDDVNPIVWMAGHLLVSRKHLLGLFGVERALPFEDLLGQKYDASKAYPSMSEIEGAWSDVSDALFDALESASDDHFAKPIDWNIPNGDKTIRGALLFYTYHEGWHMGQIAYARRAMGMEGLAPY